MLFCFMSFLLNTHYCVTCYSECHYAECCYAECRGAAERCADIEVNFCKIWNFSSHSKKKNIFEQKFENMKTLSNFVFDISKIISHFHYISLCCYIWICKLECFFACKHFTHCSIFANKDHQEPTRGMVHLSCSNQI